MNQRGGRNGSFPGSVVIPEGYIRSRKTRFGRAARSGRCLVLDAPVPSPARDPEVTGDGAGVVRVSRQPVGRGPGEVVVEDATQREDLEAHVLHRRIEAGDRPAIHLLVRAVPAVEAD